MITILLFSSIVFAEDEDCKFFKYCGSNSSASSAKGSSPSISSAAGLNPALVAKIRGFGVEAIYEKNNGIDADLATGNGKFGRMIASSSSSGENNFLGNRAIELDDDFLNRSLQGKKYKNNKFHLALGFQLIEKNILN